MTSYKNIADSSFSDYDKQIGNCIDNSLYDSIDKYTDSILLIIQRQISMVEATKAPANALKFKQSSIAYLNALSVVAKSYKGYLILNDEKATIIQIDSIKQNIKSSENILDSVLSQLILDQNTFAQSSNIKLIQ